MFHTNLARCGRMSNAALQTFGYPAVVKGGTYVTANNQDFDDMLAYEGALIIAATLLVSASSVKGLVSNSMPGSRCPFPTAAFTANPVLKSTFNPGRSARA